MNDDSSARIAAALRVWVAQAAPGARLPSTRAIVSEHGASPVTVQRALRTLAGEGLTESRPGVGTFVRVRRTLRTGDVGWQTAALGAARPVPRTSAPLRTPTDGAVALHSGYPDRDLLPERLVRAAIARAGRGDAAVGRVSAAGDEGLRAWFASALGSAVPTGLAAPTASDVVVVPGSQSGLAATFRSIVGAGRPMLIESPTYWGAIRAATQAGIELVPVPVGPDGPDPDVLERAFRTSGARAFYAQPHFHNPTGVTWSPELGDRVLELVREVGAFVVEDDWAHDFGIERGVVPLAARDDAGHVVHVRSLTKSVSPAVRVAGVLARGPARERLATEIQGESMYVSRLLQQIALDVVTQPAWTTHVRRLGERLAARRAILVDAVRDELPGSYVTHVPAGGLNLWVRLPDDTDVTRLVTDAEARGVLVASGDEWFPAEPTGPFLRLNYSGPDPAGFPLGVRRLADALRAQRPVGRRTHEA